MPSVFRTICFCIAFSGASPAPLPASAAPADLAVIRSATVTAVVDGDTLMLANGQELRLTGIQAPKLALGRRNFDDWPLATNAKVVLEKLSLGKVLILHRDGNTQDRHGRILAHAVGADGTWLQGEMVAQGMARVYTFADNRSQSKDLYERERAAREQNLGIWALPYYAIRSADADALSRDYGTFQIVEGTVLDAAKVRSRVYLNFGRDYRDDFTVAIDRQVWPLFAGDAQALLDLEGLTIRVRGWIKDFNGPLIDVTHPEQIEVIHGDGSSDTALID